MARDNLREFAAVPIVLAVLGLLFVVLLAAASGPWAWIVLGLVILVALVTTAVVLMRRPDRPAAPARPERPEGAPEPPSDGVHRVLVVADAACEPVALGDAIAARDEGDRREVFVVAPALGSRTARWTGDERAYADAARHLDETLAAFSQLGIPARGHVGSHDPLQAAEDGLREFPADEIVFVVHPEGEQNWLEEGVVDAARARYPLPVTGEVAGPHPG